MPRGGKRNNSGRKKIGDKQIKIILDKEVLKVIDENFNGNTNAEKIRKCILKGIERESDGKYKLQKKALENN
ncbi:hypothetical protein SAMN02745174_02378 [Cetobacterium ceti]|uniref:Uncharacterized protein n=1 Tax=Cetobacterium ceti TaxID=180163 RepID=A0A1T4QMY3_9FUSO|nr:hypothetical protein [Cetobacterium ceti]SKA04811.1 hypothetical protein SAMN02745174_02378 [Cetobacterium ceti]